LGSYSEADNKYLVEWRRRLGLKFDNSAKVGNTQPDDAERDAYIENKIKRAIPDLAFIIGKIREDDEIRVLANYKNKINEISDEAVDEFLTIINEPRIEGKRRVDTCSIEEEDISKWTVRDIVEKMHAQQLWKTLAAITAVISFVAVAAYKAGTDGWP